MTRERINHQEEKILGKEILNLNKLKITHHAIEEFYTASNCSLEYTGAQLKSRLGEAKQITAHKHVYLENYEGKKKRIYFLDSIDPDLVYVVEKTEGKRRDVLITVTKPLLPFINQHP